MSEGNGDGVLGRLRRVILDSGMSQSAIAEKSGIDQASVSRILNEKTPRVSVQTVEAILGAVGYAIDFRPALEVSGSPEVPEVSKEPAPSGNPFGSHAYKCVSCDWTSGTGLMKEWEMQLKWHGKCPVCKVPLIAVEGGAQ